MIYLPFFVYGTLLPGQPNDHFWGNTILRHEPAVHHGADLFSMRHFPMMIEPDRCEGSVIGKLIWVDPDRFEQVVHQIDILENYDPAHHETSPYQRLQRDVFTADGESVTAYTYVGREELITGLPQIPHGDWIKHVENHNQTDQNHIWWRNRSTDQLL